MGLERLRLDGIHSGAGPPQHRQHQHPWTAVAIARRHALYPSPESRLRSTCHKTYRRLLQVNAQVFDPLGLYSAVSVSGKIIIQDLARQKLRLDDTIPSTTLERWHPIAEDLSRLSSQPVSRHTPLPINSASDQPQLHVFSDASAQAFATCAYLCSSGERPSLVFAKSRVAPLKTTTIPRLELLAVLIGVRIARIIVRELHLSPSSVTLWSDSLCVLRWINSQKSQSVLIC